MKRRPRRIGGVIGLSLLVSGCAVGNVEPAAPAGPAGFPECQAEEFDFVGEGTLRELGLHTVTPVPPPDIDRPAMIWVTSDPMPHDAGPSGGPIEMTRMLCFEFADGSGGSGWPVDPAWEPPAGAAASDDESAASAAPPMLPLVLAALFVVLTASALAFRRRSGSR